MSDNMSEYMSDRMSTKMFECHVRDGQNESQAECRQVKFQNIPRTRTPALNMSNRMSEHYVRWNVSWEEITQRKSFPI